MSAHARHDDPETSHQAAASIGDLRKRLRSTYEALRSIGPSTDERLVSLYRGYPQSASGIRSRRAELVRLGWVRWTGTTKTLPSGRQSRVWEAVS